MPNNGQDLDLQMRLRNLPSDRLEAVANGSMSLEQAEESLRVSKDEIDSHRQAMAGMTDSQLQQIAAGKAPTPTFGQKALGVVQKVGEFVDRYTGAPARAGVYDLIRSNGDLGSGVQAYADQFGQDPAKAPTGQEIAVALGDPVEIDKAGNIKSGLGSRSGLHGLLVDVAVDPTNLIPGGAIAKGGGRLLGQGTRMGLKTATEGAETAARAAHLGPVIDFAKSSTEGARLGLSKLFKPTVAEDFKELAAIAQKNQVPLELLPESVEFGPSSIISRASRTKREGVLGEQALKNFEAGLQRVREATDGAVGKIANGPVLDKVEAGNLIRAKYDEAVEKFFSGIDVSYNSIIRDFPGLRLSDDAMKGLESSLSGIEKFAKGRLERGVTELQRGQAAGLMNAVAAIHNTNGSVKQTVEALRDIGEAAFKSQNTLAAIPADIQKMRKLYGDITDALMKTIKTEVSPAFGKDGQAIVDQLVANNKKMHEFFSDKAIVDGAIGNKALAPEGVFRTLIENGDTKKLESLGKILDPETMQQLKGAMVNSLIKRGDDGLWTFRQVRNSMINKRTILEAMLTPDELKEVGDLVRLGDRFGPTVLSTSGTGASNILRDLWQGAKEGLTNEAFIEALKNRARKGVAATSEIDSAALKLPEAPIPTPSLLPNALQPLLRLPRRGPIETGLKFGQVYSTQNQNRAKP